MKHIYKKAQLLKNTLLVALVCVAGMANAQLNGNYTIDKNSAASATNYRTFASLVSDLVSGTRSDGGTPNKAGVSGEVTVTVVKNSGPYTEQISIGVINGVSATRTITIKGNGETIQATPTSSAAAHVIQINGADYITFDSLNVVGLSASIGRGFWLTNASDFITIRNCNISFPNMTSMTSNNNAYIALTTGTSSMLSYGNPANDVQILNNKMFSGVNRGPYSGIAVMNETSGSTVRKVTISGNEIKDIYYTGIWSYYAFQHVITNNEIHNTGSSTTGTKSGMWFINSNKGGDHLIDNNYVHDLTTATAVHYGIYMSASNGTGAGAPQITHNRIVLKDLKSTFYGVYLYSYINYFYGEFNVNFNDIIFDNITNTGTAYGIYNYVYYSYNAPASNIIGNYIEMVSQGSQYAIMDYLAYSSFSKPSWIKNNIINLQGRGFSYGIYAYAWGSSFNTHIVHNTISSDDYPTASATSTKYLIYPGYTTGDCKNNIISTQDNGGTVYPIYYWAGSTKFDHNNHFTSGASANVLWYNSGTAYNNFNDYKTNLGGSKEIAVNPKFFDPAKANFTPTSFEMVNKAEKLTGVTADRNKATRNGTAPDIGALEYYIDVAVSNFSLTNNTMCGGTKEVIKVTVTNNNNMDINGIPLAYDINGVRKTMQVMTATIAAKQSADFTFTVPAEFNFPGNGVIRVYLDGTDDNTANNEVSQNVTVIPSPWGGSLAEGSTFPGYFRQGGSGGLMSNPDVTIPDMEITYNINNPSGYTNGTYGSGWDMTAYVMTSNGMPVTSGVTLTTPSGSNMGTIAFKPAASLMDSMVLVGIKATNKTTMCDSVFGRWVYIPHTPVVDFEFKDVCDGDVVEFRNISKLVKGNMLYDWQFNDPNSNEDATDVSDPIYKYTTFGSYSTTLNIKLAQYPKFVFSKTKNVTVTPVPVIDFKVLNACEKLPVTIINSTALPAGIAGNISYNWNFGGAGTGDPATARNPKFTYSKAGGYQITLTATSNGCSSTLTKNANQFALPKAAFTAKGTCNLEEINFTNNSTIAIGNTGFMWNFGDGGISNLREPKHIFQTAGSKTVKLMAISEFGCKDSSVVMFNLAESPKADFDFSDPCNLTAVKFNRAGTLPAGVNSIFEWDFNGEGVSTNENPSFLFNTLGLKEVSLNVRSANGCSDHITKTFAVKLQAKANFTAKDVCEGDQVSFTNSSTVAAGNLMYEWRFGDGNISSKTSPKHAYSVTGESKTFLVTLVANIPGGCSDSVTRPVTVNAKADAGFTADVQGRTVIFTQNSTDASSNYNWRFGDGGRATSVNPVYVYNNIDKGTFQACLGVINASGCLSESCQNITINLVSVNNPVNTLFNVYPNPTNGLFTIELSNNLTADITLFDATGKAVFKADTNGSNMLQIDASNLVQGVYLLQVNNEGTMHTERIIVSK